MCQDCDLPVDVTDKKIRLRGKVQSDGSTRLLQCPLCNSKWVMMSMEVGAWPTKEFEELPKDEQIAFYRQPSKLKVLRMKYADSLAKHQADRQKQRSVGQFQPLSYWGKIGYDEERIERETLPEDTSFSPQLGRIYRGHVKSTEHELEQSQVR